MKTTIDLDDALLIEAKAIAARRRTTLKDLVSRSLRREIGLDQPEAPSEDSAFEIGPLGLPVLKRRSAAKPVTFEQVEALEREMEEVELQRAIALAADHDPSP